MGLLFCMAGCLQQPSLKTGLEGKKLPSFTFLLMDSTTRFNTDSLESGKPFVMFYFNPDCPYCRTELRDIIQHNNEFNNIMFYLLTAYPYGDVKRFSNEFHLKEYANITIGIDYTNYLYKYLYIPSVPYLAIYDKEKRLKQVLMGKTDYKKIKMLCQ